MKGSYKIQIRNNRLSVTLEIQRNITVIQGDSATGKTTFIEMLQNYERFGKQSGITIQSKKKCHVLTDMDWEDRLPKIQDSIVFVDEGNRFVTSSSFAKTIMGTDNYYVLITRENLYQLPYSVDAILKLKTTTSRFKTTYVKSYPNYDTIKPVGEQLFQPDLFLTEDSNSGFEMFSEIAYQYEMHCESANGKSNILLKLRNLGDLKTIVVADGAAFGAEMDKVYAYYKLHPGKIVLYLPESFEWLLLKSGILGEKTPVDILKNPAAYIDSRSYFSWEQFFTALLTELTSNSYMQYNKHKLNSFYLQPSCIEKVLAETGLQKCFEVHD